MGRKKFSRAAFALTHVTEILENVLEYLPALQLLQVQTVCTHWQNASKNVLKRRSQSKLISTSSIAKFYAKNESVYSVHRIGMSRKAVENLYSTGWEESGSCTKDFKVARAKWHNIPQFVISNCTDIFWNSHSGDYLETDMTKGVGPKIASMLPKTCQCLLLSTSDGIIASDNHYRHLEFIDSSYNVKIFTNVFAMPNFSQDFSINTIMMPILNSFEKNNFTRKMTESVMNNDDLKFILMFYRPKVDAVKLCGDVLTTALKKKIVVTGCEIGEPAVIFTNSAQNYINNNNKRWRLRSSMEDKGSNNDMVALLFSGQSMKVASVLADSNVVTGYALNEVLLKLKSAVNHFYETCKICNLKEEKSTEVKKCEHNKRQNIGFIIANDIRANGSYWYNQTFVDLANPLPNNLEQDVFRYNFPGIPIFGLHGLDVFGASLNININDTKLQGKFCARDILNPRYETRTTFVILSF